MKSVKNDNREGQSTTVSTHEQAEPTAVSRCGFLTAVTATVWLLVTGPAYLMSGTLGLEGASYAALLCLVPGWLVFLIVERYFVAHAQVAGVLAGTVLRMLFVLGGLIGIRAARPELGFREFIVWILVFYMATLLTETLMLVKHRSA